MEADEIKFFDNWDDLGVREWWNERKRTLRRSLAPARKFTHKLLHLQIGKKFSDFFYNSEVHLLKMKSSQHRSKPGGGGGGVGEVIDDSAKGGQH